MNLLSAKTPENIWGKWGYELDIRLIFSLEKQSREFLIEHTYFRAKRDTPFLNY